MCHPLGAHRCDAAHCARREVPCPATAGAIGRTRAEQSRRPLESQGETIGDTEPLAPASNRTPTATGFRVAHRPTPLVRCSGTLTADQVAAGTGSPAALPLTPDIPYIATPDSVEGVVALSETRLVVVKYADGALYRIDLDPQAPQGRTITPITGSSVPLGSRMDLDGNRLVVADENGVFGGGVQCRRRPRDAGRPGARPLVSRHDRRGPCG